MLKTERLRVLADALAKQNVMRLRDAATLLGVSEMTVRRDIAASRLFAGGGEGSLRSSQGGGIGGRSEADRRQRDAVHRLRYDAHYARSAPS